MIDDEIAIARLRSRIIALRTALLAVQSTRRKTSPPAAHRAMRQIAFDALENDNKAESMHDATPPARVRTGSR